MSRPKVTDTTAQEVEARKQRAAALRGQGLSLSAIGAELGVTRITVARDLADIASRPAPLAPGEDGPARDLARFQKAKADEQVTKAKIAQLNLERMQGELIPKTAVLAFLQGLRGRLTAASGALKRVYPPGVEVLADAVKGLNEEADVLLGATREF